jgi:hypothetical protein
LDTDLLLEAVRNSLVAIRDPRFYETERGFQGQLLAELAHRMPDLFPADYVIIEQEHQKTLARHGITLRPDVIIHQPYDPAIHATRRDGNFAVIALKLRAGPTKALGDFKDLITMMDVLHYPVGIFINIGHSHPQFEHTPAGAQGRIVAFATRLEANNVLVVEERA